MTPGRRAFKGIRTEREAAQLLAAGQVMKRKREAEREDLEARHPGAPIGRRRRRGAPVPGTVARRTARKDPRTGKVRPTKGIER